jgi:hypothetical protein
VLLSVRLGLRRSLCRCALLLILYLSGVFADTGFGESASAAIITAELIMIEISIFIPVSWKRERTLETRSGTSLVKSQVERMAYFIKARSAWAIRSEIDKQKVMKSAHGEISYSSYAMAFTFFSLKSIHSLSAI